MYTGKEEAMQSNILSAKWTQLVGEVKKKWSKLTDDDITHIEGERDKLAGVLQEKYGYSKDKAFQEVDSWVDNLK